MTDTTNTFFVANRFGKGLPEGNATIFGTMMVIYLDITRTSDVNINQTMTHNLVEHVVDKRHTRIELALTSPV